MAGQRNTREVARANGALAAFPVAGADDAEHLGKILDTVPHVIWTADPQGMLTFVSRQWVDNHGGSQEDVLRNGWLGFIHPDDQERVGLAWSAAKNLAEPYDIEFRVRYLDGAYGWVLIRAKPETDAGGGITRWIGTCTDVNDRVLARNALHDSERLHRSVLEASADCIKVLDAEGRVELMNAPGLRLMELANFDEVRGCDWASLWPEGMRATVAGAVATASSNETARFTGFCPTAENTPKWWDVVVTPIRDELGKVTRLLAISRDMTGDREKSEELRWTSEHDALTGLPNRRAFQNRLHAATLRAMSAEGKLGLLLIDLDHFKHINDSLGHPVGDALLKEFGARLQGCIRSTDFVARVGGDEFAVIMENITGAADLLKIGEKISVALNLPLRIEGRVLSGGASIGGALFPLDAANANELFKLADTALYALKAQGRGGIKLFQSHMREEAQRIASQLSLARVALSETSVLPFYQPKVSLHTGACEGVEALLRWAHPNGAVHLPETIGEAFKDYELASKIGDLMQRKVFSDIRQWSHQGFQFGRVSINAAPAEFMRDDFAERVLDRLAQFNVAPSTIEIEITEQVLMERGSEFVARALTVLKSHGVNVALDDFGTGYSSLSHLRDYPVDVVKIDKSFVQGMEDNPEIAAIVTAVVNLAGSLGIQSVAEGVETANQKELLRVAGCDLGQGYLFGRPVDVDVMAKTYARACDRHISKRAAA